MNHTRKIVISILPKLLNIKSGINYLNSYIYQVRMDIFKERNTNNWKSNQTGVNESTSIPNYSTREYM